MLNSAVIKLSGEAIGCHESDSGYNEAVIADITKQIKQVVQAGTQVSLVIGGGNYWRGRQANSEMDRVKADQMGMLATVMNALYLADAFRRIEQKSKVITPIPIGNITTLYAKDSAQEMLNDGIVLINAAGLGHPMFSTDTVTVLRAAELEADCVFFAKNTDGVYSADPRKNTNAKKFRTLSYQYAISNGLNVADMTALSLAQDANIDSYVFALNKKDSIALACSNFQSEKLHGTYISVSAKEDYYE